MSRTDAELLSEALTHFESACASAQLGDVDPALALDAMTMRLFAGLERLTRLPDDVADRLFSDSWPDMRGLRNRIAHGYGAINLRRVRTTVLDRLPTSMDSIRRELGST